MDDFLAGLLPYVRSGLDNGEPVFVAARGDFLPALRAELGSGAGGAHLVDTFEWHPHPSTRLRAFNDFVTDRMRAGVTRVRLAGEPVWPQDAPSLVREWQRYESVLNTVLAPFPVSLMCLYDSSRLAPALVETAHRTHPTICSHEGSRSSRDFESPEQFLRRWNHPLSPPPAWAKFLTDITDVAAPRRFLIEQAALEGVEPHRASDLAIAANEVLTNALVHATGPSLCSWSDQSRFVCQIADRGAGIRDSLAGYRPPSEERQGGRGLWIARQLVDLLQIVPSATGTVVRLHVPRG